MECLANIRTYDPMTNSVTRACMIYKCTKNGVVTEHAVCSDNFGNSSGTDLEECCCYGDGCNGSDVDEPLKDFADGRSTLEWV
ncbi:hypothetical protein AAVH_13950 [Aphelenchoides avenae]|nr:hypothetical protein AAVH_13950 [Aphelenchus avenae]